MEIGYDCPYCGEPGSVVLDMLPEEELDAAERVEDCWVCCRPIVIRIFQSAADDMTGAGLRIHVHREDE